MLVPQRFRPALLGTILLLAAGLAWASITGSISGVVTDPSGAVIPDVTVTATNTQTGIQSTTKTDSKGFYNFPTLPVGTYDVETRQSGFKTFKQGGVVIDANSAIRVDVKLQIGETAEEVTVTSDAVRVETESTQMGQVITGMRMTAVPLNGRAYTDLLSLQPGVVPSGYGSLAPDINSRNPSGNLNAGNQSVNGQREAANGFLVNGATVEEGRNNGAAIIPNLDSISEFRIITNNADAEYGNYSGGQVNVVTKSGTNQFHGSVFEFLRNTVLDARNFFDVTGKVPEFKQNQFGAGAGGPIKRDKLFFFGDYQGTRNIEGLTQNFLVPSSADRSGNLSDLAASLTGTVTSGPGPNPWASVLSTRLRYTVNAGEPYFFTGCTTATCVFPNAVIPQSAWAPTTVHFLPLIPTPTPGAGGFFNTSAFSRNLRDDKGAIRVDGNSRFGMLSAYYFLDDYTLDDPYPNGSSPNGASAPGYNALTNGRGQLVGLSDTKAFSSSSVNEFRVAFMRFANVFSKPHGGVGTTLASLGFVAGFNQPGGIGPVEPKFEGVPTINFNNFSLGLPSITPAQYNNTYQVLDNFSKIIGTHTIKFGGQFHYDQINGRNLFGENGDFTFGGGETGSDFGDFLIGAPNSNIQASKQVLDSRSKYMGLYGQDSWRVTSNLTLNYGLRWEFSQPWYDTQNKTETIIPGRQSVLFPTAPKGWLVAGDPGVPPTLAPTRYNNFAPRIGIAYSPGAQGGWMERLTGGPGKMSIRASFGIYYTAYEDLSQFLEIGDQPYGVFFVTPNPPLFQQPYTDRSTGFTRPQPFPFVIPTGVTAKNPDTTFPWSVVEPISSGFVFFPTNRLPYAEHYDLSLQRQLGGRTVLSLSYVGNQAHRLMTSLEANPGIANLCNELNTLSASPSCSTFGENPSPPGYVLPPGVPFPADAPSTVQATTPCGAQTCNVVTTTRTALGPAFSSNPYMIAMGNSAYNSFQASVRHTSAHASFDLGYTYSKSLDNSSGLEDTTNVFNIRASRSLSLFDVTHNFVASYSVDLPFDKLFHAESGWSSRILGGWSVSGITTFATGLPVTLEEPNDDNSLTGAIGVDVPQLTGTKKVLNNTNPRSGHPYFNSFSPSGGGAFDAEPIGKIGNANRRIFHGPGLNNWDMALLKDTKITESKSLEFRAEAFNIFNHAQFNNPDGNLNDGFPDQGGTFGLVTSARASRVMQIGLKFLF